MPYLHKKRIVQIKSIDNSIVGLWNISGSQVRITSDGWSSSLSGDVPYEITPDGSLLKYPSTGNITEFNRIFGNGQELTGVWQMTETDGGDVWILEMHFRMNGTYTFQWTLNGNFDSEGLGNYSSTPANIATEERRAIVQTSGVDQISFDPLYSPYESGIYSVDASGDAWTYHGASGDLTYIRA